MKRRFVQIKNGKEGKKTGRREKGTKEVKKKVRNEGTKDRRIESRKEGRNDWGEKAAMEKNIKIGRRNK